MDKKVKAENGFVSTGDALEVVLEMAQHLYQRYGVLGNVENPHTMDVVFKVVEDLIVNHYGDEE